MDESLNLSFGFRFQAASASAFNAAVFYIKECRAMFLNNGSRVITVCNISKGGMTETSVDMYCVPEKAILHKAPLVLCHNHPSGNVRPGRQDDLLMEKMHAAYKIMNLRMLDHLIVDDSRFTAMPMKC